VTEPEQDPEIPWDAIEAAFRNFRRAQEERAEIEKRLRQDRDSSEREAGRVFEENVKDINHIALRVKELEAGADEAVGQFAPFRGRRWDVPEVLSEDGIPQERLPAALQDCEAEASELTQAANEYAIAKGKEEARRNLRIFFAVVAAGIACFMMAVTGAVVSEVISNMLGETSVATVEPAAASTAVGRSDRISDSTSAGAKTFATTTGTGTGARTAGTATPAGHQAATATCTPPSPTPSHTSTPGATATRGYDTSGCSQSVGPTFRLLWARDRAALGCPLEPQHGLVTAYQAFEHGYMVYRADQAEKGYALFEDGEWQAYSANWQDGMPEYSCPDDSTPSTTPPTPRRGFGFVWCQSAVVRQRLGWATTDELGNWRNFQAFQGGWAIELEQVADSPKLVLLDDGSWHWE
jgi:hypothetical protein